MASDPSCHVKACNEVGTARLQIGNNFSYKDKWTTPLFYCPDHAAKVGMAMVDRGLRVLITETSDLVREARSE